MECSGSAVCLVWIYFDKATEHDELWSVCNVSCARCVAEFELKASTDSYFLLSMDIHLGNSDLFSLTKEGSGVEEFE